MSKMLDKVSKLLAKAENAGTPEEAEAFMAKAQEMAAQNGLDLAVARMHQAKKERVEDPEERRIQVSPYTRKQNRKHFMELAMHIADVNDVRYLVGGGDYVLHAVGFPSDLDVVEAMYTHLSLQMVTQCDAALKAGANRRLEHVPKQTWEDIPYEARAWGDWCDGDGGYYYNDEPSWPKSASYDPPSRKLVPVVDEHGEYVYEDRNVAVTDGRVFRHEFYGAFTSRMQAKLWGAKREAMAAAGVEAQGSNETSLAIRDKTAEVNTAHEEQRAKVKHLGVYHGSDTGRSGWDRTGNARELGRQAAEATSLGTSRGMKGRNPELSS